MAFVERSYSGKLFRPTPEVAIEDGNGFGVIATPWGTRPSAEKVTETVRDHVLSSSQDLEATSPFQKLSCISPLANTLRVAMMLANDTVYREENKAEYQSGLELVLFAHSEGEFAFAQVGLPNLYLARPGFSWIPLSVQMDLSTELSTVNHIFPPLPQNLIGIHTTTNMIVSSIMTRPGDRIVFLSHSVPSSMVFSTPFEKTGLDQITQSLSHQYPEVPFWLGVLEL